MYESPLGFQAPKLLWSWVLIIKYAFEEIADVLGEKKVGLWTWSRTTETCNNYDSFHPVQVVSTEEWGGICSNLHTILIYFFLII